MHTGTGECEAVTGEDRAIHSIMVVSAVVFIAMVMVLFAIVASPSLSPIASVGDWDGDGHTNDSDTFPRDGSEWADSDEDGVGDNADAFPHDKEETEDSDGDGVGDNADFMDQGDAVLRITLDSFEFIGYEENYVRTRYSPNAWFKILVDVDGDGKYDTTGTSEIFNATRSLRDFFSFTVDVDDDVASAKFIVRAYDVWEVSANNETDSEEIDYSPVSDEKAVEHTWTLPWSDSWESDGNGDDDTPDCYLEYSVETVVAD